MRMLMNTVLVVAALTLRGSTVDAAWRDRIDGFFIIRPLALNTHALDDSAEDPNGVGLSTNFSATSVFTLESPGLNGEANTTAIYDMASDKYLYYTGSGIALHADDDGIASFDQAATFYPEDTPYGTVFGIKYNGNVKYMYFNCGGLTTVDSKLNDTSMIFMLNKVEFLRVSTIADGNRVTCQHLGNMTETMLACKSRALTDGGNAYNFRGGECTYKKCADSYNVDLETDPVRGWNVFSLHEVIPSPAPNTLLSSTQSCTTTPAPTTPAPTTPAPTTPAPTTPAPTTPAPTTPAPTTPAPTTQAPTTQAPTTQAPTTQAPTTQAPTTQAPTTQAPTTQAPTTQAPTTQAPTTQAPTTQAPTTQAPTTQAPTTQAPTTQAPTTPAPTTPAPTTPAPTTPEPAYMPSVDCQYNQVVVTVEKQRVDHMDVANMYAGGNSNCTGVDTGTDMVFTFNLHDCNPEVSMSVNDYVKFTYTLSTPSDTALGAISRFNPGELEAFCLYPRNGVVNVAYEANRTFASYIGGASGDFSFSFSLYPDNTFATSFDQGAIIPVGTVVFADIRFANTASNLNMFVQDCVATPQEENATYSYELIQSGGCFGDDSTFAVIAANVESKRYSFSFDAFRFTGVETDDVYLTCNVYVCESSAPASGQCQQPRDCSGLSRRSNDDPANTFPISFGPIKVL